MRLILGNQRAAISLRRRIVIACHLRIESAMQAKQALAIKGGSTEWYVTEEVNPINRTPLSEKRARCANTKTKVAAKLVFEGAVPSYSTYIKGS